MNPCSQWSDEIDNTPGNEIMLILGEIGAGKTFLASTIDPAFPKNLPAPKMVSLKSIFRIVADKKATAGYRHNNIRERQFDINQFMSEANLYKKAGFSRKPSIIEALNQSIKEAREAKNQGCINCVVDTLTSIDVKMMQHHNTLWKSDPDPSVRRNMFYPYGLNKAAHILFSEELYGLGMNLILLVHSRAASTDTQNDRDKNVSTLIAGGARYIPDLTGAAPAIYKRHASMQLVITATRDARTKKLIRKVYAGYNELGWEGKNRYEGLIPDVNEPSLAKIMQIIKTGKRN